MSEQRRRRDGGQQEGKEEKAGDNSRYTLLSLKKKTSIPKSCKPFTNEEGNSKMAVVAPHLAD
jgi:hypothetical protein